MVFMTELKPWLKLKHRSRESSLLKTLYVYLMGGGSMIGSSGPVIIPHWSFTSGPSVRPCLKARSHVPSTTATAAIVVRFDVLHSDHRRNHGDADAGSLTLCLNRASGLFHLHRLQPRKRHRFQMDSKKING